MPGSRETTEEKHARSMVKTTDVSDEQCLFCPLCRSTSIDMVDETAPGFLSTVEEWRCKDCGEHFLVETRLFITYGEAGKRAR